MYRKHGKKIKAELVINEREPNYWEGFHQIQFLSRQEQRLHGEKIRGLQQRKTDHCFNLLPKTSSGLSRTK